jgi:hypothetical protein
MQKVVTIKRSNDSFGKRTFLYIFLVGIHFSTLSAFAQATSSLSETVTVNAVVISTTISPAPPASPGPVSNNGVPLTNDSGTDIAIFRGRAYPQSFVAILKNGLIVNELPANSDGTFEVPVNNIKPGTYTFGIRAKDKNGLLSSVLSYTIYIVANVETEVNNIFIPPTLTTDKIEVKKGDSVIFSGSSFPRAELTLNIFAKSGVIKTAKANDAGLWAYSFSTVGLEFGDYNSKATAKIGTVSSLYSSPVSFTVGTANRIRGKVSPVKNHCDLNNDSRVNLLDFSIMAFWYKRLGFPAKVDLNSDSRVNLTDLSILAYCWTG